MGEGELQRLISELLRPMLARFLAERHIVAHVGADQFLYFVKGDPTQRIAPDIYVLPGIAQSRIAPSWKLWEVGVAPSFCLEIVSVDVAKDYEDSPATHGELGASELVVFDPMATGQRGRWRWQVYRRTTAGFRLSERTNADRVRSRALHCFLRVVGRGDEQRVRVATGPHGDALMPTLEEERERERGEKERERAEKEALERRVAELERKLKNR